MQASLHNNAPANQHTPQYEVDSVARDFAGEELNHTITKKDSFSSQTRECSFSQNLTTIKNYAIEPIPSLDLFNLTNDEEHLHSSNAERRSAQNRAAASLHTAGTAAGTSKEARERDNPGKKSSGGG